MSGMWRERGFTIMEMVVVLGIFAVLVGLLVPVGAQLLENERREAARRQLLRARSAVLGTAERGVPAASRSRGSAGRSGTEGGFGFLGDVGALPDTIVQLVIQDTLPAYAVEPGTGLGAGWRGPYVTPSEGETPAEAFLDPFGRAIRYATADTTVDGVTWAGFLRSGGPDRTLGTVGSSPVPLRADEVRGDAVGFLRHGTGEPISDASVSYFFRDDGRLDTATLVTDVDGRFAPPTHALGPALAETGAVGSPSMGYVRNVARVTGAANNELEVRFVNVTRPAVTLTALTASWTAPGVDHYNDLVVDGVDVDGGGANPHSSGGTVSFTQGVRVVGGASFGASRPSRRFVLRNSTQTVPDLTIAGSSGRSGRGEVVIELRDWEDGSGTEVDVRGIQITITLSDGTSTTFTTPSS